MYSAVYLCIIGTKIERESWCDGIAYDEKILYTIENEIIFVIHLCMRISLYICEESIGGVLWQSDIS